MKQRLQFCLAFRGLEVLVTFRREVGLKALRILAMFDQHLGNRLIRSLQAGSCLFIDTALVVVNATRGARNLDEDGVSIAGTSSTLCRRTNTLALAFALGTLRDGHTELFSREVVDSLEVDHQIQSRLNREVSGSEELHCRHLQFCRLLLERFDLAITLTGNLAIFLKKIQVLLHLFRLEGMAVFVQLCETFCLSLREEDVAHV
ncbi:hypothetical protein C6P74_24105 [Burkholderia multivorans]|nr:hypothetical protein C6P74_24105 [Burkholderia multivorans]